MTVRSILSRSLIVAAITGAGVAMSFAPAFAQSKISSKVKKACAGDYRKLCPQYKVGSPQLRACMEAKQSNLSWGCISALIDSGEVNRSARR